MKRSKARTVLPTDLVALASWEGEAYGNEAWPWERFGTGEGRPHPLESAIEQWFSFATGRHTWVHVQGQTLRGLASARRRSSGTIWEIDCLIAADGDVCLGLLDRLCENAARSGVEKVFLRLDEDSRLLPTVRRAGFMSYVREQLWRGEATRGALTRTDLRLRPRTAADTFPLFRLYNAAVPSLVREAEGPTMREWLAGKERGLSRAKELVLQRDGAIVGWARLARVDAATRLDVLLHPDEHEHMDTFLTNVCSRSGNARFVFCIVPNYIPSLASALAARGFQPQGEYVALLRRLTRPIHAVEPLPVAVKEGITLPTLLTKS